MDLSYWEIKSWLTNIDFTIVGSGIVGLSCALNLKEHFPKANILVLEKGMLPQGASTKNAGFACFGSLSEVLEDLKSHTEAEVLELVKKRVAGLQLLRQTLGDKTINYQELGGYELFIEENDLLEQCLSKKTYINKLLKPIFENDVFSTKPNDFKFQNVKNQYIFNQFEGQIDTGKMMAALTQLALKKEIRILNNITVRGFSEDTNTVKIKTNTFEFSTSKLLIATNGFASELLEEDVKPARAQVLITRPIKNLHIKGTFHLDKGYYYFRNIDNRILLGGGRHLDFKGEETTEFNQTALIQNKLETLLKTIILPEMNYEIDFRWSGIMGVGSRIDNYRKLSGQKKAVVKQLSNHVFCGVRLGGMGIAIGSLVGKELADLISE
ncbi:FAD-dependent oxidoreductase [Flavivirga aquimarina]|uniref:FAD-dependent oxidoreductase n=1 Tax=Flavivirga aquimarina TaxID=2027862 RepID=A0ABT8WBF5_9FLAO|nr:FAD-dependent oxidoreductase [Flavivirga aquimarina]MDO5970362.1 FAD-dependent oxidoreductase [Flavivirga aquimarina]